MNLVKYMGVFHKFIWLFLLTFIINDIHMVVSLVRKNVVDRVSPTKFTL